MQARDVQRRRAGRRGLSGADFQRHLRAPHLLDGAGGSGEQVQFYDGKIRVVDPEGRRLGKYAPREYPTGLAEHVEPWTSLKVPYFKNIGWKGLVDGEDSGVYMASPHSRLNVSERLATPLAEDEYEKPPARRRTPVHRRLAIHHARLIELLAAAERRVELATDPEITSDNPARCPVPLRANGPAASSRHRAAR